MGSINVPGQTIQQTSVGFIQTGLSNVILFLKINGVIYSNGYRITYSNDGNVRDYFAGYNPSNGQIKLYCRVVGYNQTIPQETLSLEVLVAN